MINNYIKLERKVQEIVNNQIVEYNFTEIKHSKVFVLLGDGGLGKTTLLSNESDIDNRSIVNVHEFVETSYKDYHQGTIIIDHLDEIRFDSNVQTIIGKFKAKIKTLNDNLCIRFVCRNSNWAIVNQCLDIINIIPNAKIYTLLPFSIDEAKKYIISKCENGEKLIAFLNDKRNISSLFLNAFNINLLIDNDLTENCISIKEFYGKFYELSLSKIKNKHINI